MKLEGSLATFPLRELVEMCLYSSVTGVLTVYWEGGEGRLFFYDSQLYHAEAAEVTGIDAVAAVFEQSEARFSFVDETRAEKETLWGDVLEIMDRAEHLARRWARLRSSITHLRLVPRLLIQGDEIERRVPPEYLALCHAIDGVHTIEDTARSMGWEMIVTCEALAHLHDDGLLTFARPDPVIPREQTTAAAALSARERKGFFERILAQKARSQADVSAPPTQAPLLRSTPAPVTAAAVPAPVASATTNPAEDTILRLLRG